MNAGGLHAVVGPDVTSTVRESWPCWACVDGAPERGRACAACGAPPWDRGDGPGGIYILEAQCGLTKIGISRSIPGRISQLQSESAEALTLLTTLPGAGRDVERWLHGQFGETRDRAMARTYGLPNASEWFWPTPALRRLASDLEFIRNGVLWEMS